MHISLNPPSVKSLQAQEIVIDICQQFSSEACQANHSNKKISQVFFVFLPSILDYFEIIHLSFS